MCRLLRPTPFPPAVLLCEGMLCSTLAHWPFGKSPTGNVVYASIVRHQKCFKEDGVYLGSGDQTQVLMFVRLTLLTEPKILHFF